MLNYETILSSYDDKLTLMQWLKKVEDALANASAVAFNVTKTGDATITFSLDFEDGSKIESGPIVLQQGESVESAAISNGHLLLTLTNGDVLDAGNLFNGNVTLSGNLSVTGTISGNIPVLTTAGDKIDAQKPVVEVMTGYSASINAELDTWTKSIVYVGACKNGNKLTFIACLKLTKTSGSLADPAIIDFTIPNEIGEQLYPAGAGGGQYLDQKAIPCFETGSAYVLCPMRVNKVNNSTIRMFITSANLVENHEYVLRYEVTFLLSDNLAA